MSTATKSPKGLHEQEVLLVTDTDEDGEEEALIRMAVPGGWLYQAFTHLEDGSIFDVATIFVPDLRADRFEAAVDVIMRELHGQLSPMANEAVLRTTLLAKLKEMA